MSIANIFLSVKSFFISAVKAVCKFVSSPFVWLAGALGLTLFCVSNETEEVGEDAADVLTGEAETAPQDNEAEATDASVETAPVN